MATVLILNQDYRAISICSVQRAFTLLFLNKAEMIHNYKDKYIHTVSRVFPYPSVIRLNRYVHFAYRGLSVSRQNILKRDNHRCQYCGTKSNLTIDHVIPKSRGGKSTWDNLVTACQKCNSKKGDRTPDEASMKLCSIPTKPSFLSFLKNFNNTDKNEWTQYLV